MSTTHRPDIKRSHNIFEAVDVVYAHLVRQRRVGVAADHGEVEREPGRNVRAHRRGGGQVAQQSRGRGGYILRQYNINIRSIGGNSLHKHIIYTVSRVNMRIAISRAWPGLSPGPSSTGGYVPEMRWSNSSSSLCHGNTIWLITFVLEYLKYNNNVHTSTNLHTLQQYPSSVATSDMSEYFMLDSWSNIALATRHEG